ncbi:MAG: heparinase II/III family protein, partial [Victivallaceae bacterium]
MMKRLVFAALALGWSVGAVAAPELTAEEKKLAARPPAEYAALITPPEVPRAFDVHRDGCPVCGDRIKKHGRYSWIIDETKPFKLQCPECKTVFPDNDYAAYLKSGLKDKSLLTGKYVDDGRGWKDGDKPGKYWFVAYYNHWTMKRRVETLLPQLADAYVRTGDPAFAERAVVMLDKLAEYYPLYDYNKQSRYAEEVYPHYTGRIVNAIWETFIASAIAESWQKVAPVLDKEAPALRAATGKDNAAIRANIEDNMLRVMANDIMSENGRIQGNFGMHQRALLKIAIALKGRGGKPDDQAMVRWVTDYRKNSVPFSAPFDYVLYDNVFGDGAPMESPGYNALWLSCIAMMAEILRDYGMNYAELHPFSKRLFTYPAKLVVCGVYSPSSGDSGSIAGKGIYGGNLSTLGYSFATNPTPESAALLLTAKGITPEERAAAEKIADPLFGYRSNLLSAYGMASLQNENPAKPLACWLSFGFYPGHKHRDALNFEIFTGTGPLMPDFGYPDSASADDPTRFAFYENTLVHNTMVVDARAQDTKSGRILAYDPGKFAQYLRAEAPQVYPGMTKYERSGLAIEPEPGKLIVLDVFRAAGGKQHDLFFHSAGEKVETNLELKPQSGGTLAGEKVEAGTFYDDPKLAKMEKGPRSFTGYRGSGYQYLTNVRSGANRPGAVLKLPVSETSKLLESGKGTFLRIHPVANGAETVIVSEGPPPRTQRGAPDKVVFVTRRRVAGEGEKVLKSNFVTVLENGPGTMIGSVEALKQTEELVALKIKLDNGDTLYCFDAVAPQPEFKLDGIAFAGQSGAILIGKDGRQKASYMYGAKPAFKAKVTAVDLKAETLTLDREIPAELGVKGAFFTAGKAAYRIGEVSGKVVKLLDQSPVRGRFRFESFDEGLRTGTVSPRLVLARGKLGLYGADGKTW